MKKSSHTPDTHESTLATALAKANSAYISALQGYQTGDTSAEELEAARLAATRAANDAPITPVYAPLKLPRTQATLPAAPPSRARARNKKAQHAESPQAPAADPLALGFSL